MKLEFEYGQGLLGAELPDSTDIFIPCLLYTSDAADE